jgi:hypothetical protein
MGSEAAAKSDSREMWQSTELAQKQRNMVNSILFSSLLVLSGKKSSGVGRYLATCYNSG